MRILRSLSSAVFVVVCVALAAVMLLPAALGYERYVITSGSMAGTYDTGSIVYAKPVATDDLAVGDVITYAPPAGQSPTALVTHRIVELARDPSTAALVLRTKGDANQAADPWQFSLDAPTQARIAFGLPAVGYAFAALADREVRMLLIGLPAALVALLALLGMVREARADRRQPPAGALPV